jgi:Fe-S cluster assembly ATP-binding protein
MKHNFLKIKNLECKIDNKVVLKDINLNFANNTITAIVGPNGSGKTTLMKTILKHFSIKISKGKIFYNNLDLSMKKTDEIANLGIFYIHQNPPELNGIKNIELLRLIGIKNKKFTDFNDKINNALKTIKLNREILLRDVNVGFSGGEKKKIEILQALMFDYSVILIDEIDAGLDVDSQKIIADIINKNKKNKIIIVISHQFNFLNLIKPHNVVFLVDGKIHKKGDNTLLKKIEKNGFSSFLTKNNKTNNDSICLK